MEDEKKTELKKKNKEWQMLEESNYISKYKYYDLRHI